MKNQQRQPKPLRHWHNFYLGTHFLSQWHQGAKISKYNICAGTTDYTLDITNKTAERLMI